jgi:hypothetical protein
MVFIGWRQKMNKAYCWLPNPPNVGHASLDISFGQGLGKAEYVSWWPTGGSGSKGSRGAKPLKPGEVFQAGLNNFPDDCASEGGNPNLTVEVTCLDEDRMRATFTEMKKNLTYNMAVKSCATAVVEVLLAGGACLSFDCLAYAQRHVVWTPMETNTFAKLINMNARAISDGIKNGFKPVFQFVMPNPRSGF